MTELRALTESHFMDTFRLRLAPGRAGCTESGMSSLKYN